MKVATLTFFNLADYLEAVLHYKQKADADAAIALMELQKPIEGNKSNEKDNKNRTCANPKD